MFSKIQIRKIDLPTVYRLLKFPNVVTLDNGSTLSGVGVFLFSLDRFTSHCCVEDLFGALGFKWIQMDSNGVLQWTQTQSLESSTGMC